MRNGIWAVVHDEITEATYLRSWHDRDAFEDWLDYVPTTWRVVRWWFGPPPGAELEKIKADYADTWRELCNKT